MHRQFIRIFFIALIPLLCLQTVLVRKYGEPFPSVRHVAVDFQINPLTVSKAYQSLVDDDLVEKRRGVGMFVRNGARKQLLASEREHFLTEEWPRLVNRIKGLGLSIEELLEMEQLPESSDNKDA